MTPAVIKALSQQTLDADTSQFQSKIKDMFKLSRDAMKEYYVMWERNDRVYRGNKEVDDADRKALKKGEPAKFVLPASYAQVQTFVSFGMSVLNQREFFYELQGTGTEDADGSKIAQAVLEQNLEYNNFRYQQLRQLLTHVAKYGVGVVKSQWKEDIVYEKQMQQQQVAGMFGGQGFNVQQESVVPVTKYQGNQLRVISPFHFFPDPRVPLARFKEGEFIGSEDEYSRVQMNTFQKQGMIAGLDYVPKLSRDMMEDRRKFSFQFDDVQPTLSENFYILGELEVLLNPSKTMIGGQPLDKDKDYDCRYVVWIANDARIVRIDELDYPHQEFTYDVVQFEEDTDELINLSMVELIASLQDTMDWFVNSRITNVRKIISNQAVVDPSAIEMQDLRNRNPILRLKPQFAGTGVEKYYKQIDLRDVTTNHLNDVEFLYNYAKGATGLSDNLLGQFASGRRSAQEARNVNSNAVARVMMIVSNIWSSALLPMGRKMLANCREGMDVPQIIRVTGQSVLISNPLGMAEFKSVSKADLAGNYDFAVLDGTLPSQRQMLADALQEILTVMMSSPEAAFIFQYDPQKIMADILELRGLRNADRYKLDPTKAGQLLQLVTAARNATTPPRSQGGGGNAPAPSPQ